MRILRKKLKMCEVHRNLKNFLSSFVTVKISFILYYLKVKKIRRFSPKRNSGTPFFFFFFLCKGQFHFKEFIRAKQKYSQESTYGCWRIISRENKLHLEMKKSTLPINKIRSVYIPFFDKQTQRRR